jgi:hypothetical protein
VGWGGKWKREREEEMNEKYEDKEEGKKKIYLTVWVGVLERKRR